MEVALWVHAWVVWGIPVVREEFCFAGWTTCLVIPPKFKAHDQVPWAGGEHLGQLYLIFHLQTYIHLKVGITPCGNTHGDSRDGLTEVTSLSSSIKYSKAGFLRCRRES